MLYVTLILVIKIRLYYAPLLRKFLIINQGILTFKKVFVITIAHWKPHM